MAAAATTFSLIGLTFTNLLSPLFPFSSLRSLVRRPSANFLQLNHRLSICHVQLNGSREEEDQGMDGLFFGDGEVPTEEEEEEDADGESDEGESSLDLLFRFLQSLFRKVSKRAQKASRTILPSVIPSQLVSFAVDGVLLLGALSIAKALLEVVCTLGGTVFVVVLLLRVIWAAVSYFQLNRNGSSLNGNPYDRAQPVS